jgi:hypothetical protein
MHRIGGILKRVESGRDVEAVVGKWQLFDLADADIGARTTALGDFSQACSGIEAADFGAARLRHLQRQARATAYIQHRRSLADLGGVEGGLVERPE